MKNITIAYATVLNEFVGLEKNPMDTYRHFYNLKLAIQKNPSYVSILSSPCLSKEMSHKFITELLLEENSKEIRNTFLHLYESGNFFQILPILDCFCDVFEEKNQIIRVTATTVTPLSEMQNQRLNSILENKLEKTVILENKIDSACLGGLVLSLKTKEYDDSLQATFSRIRSSLTNNTLNHENTREV